MNHSIFDLYHPSASPMSKVRPPYVFKRTLAVKDSPDSIKWDEEDSSPRHSGLETSVVPGNCASLPQLVTDSSLPTILIEKADKKTPHVRNSLYGPIRFCPNAKRASRCFEEVYSYKSNQEIWKHFKPYVQQLASLQDPPSPLPVPLRLPNAFLQPSALGARNNSLMERGTNPSPVERSPAGKRKSPEIQKSKGKPSFAAQPLRLQPLPAQAKLSFTQASVAFQPTRKARLRATLD